MNCVQMTVSKARVEELEHSLSEQAAVISGLKVMLKIDPLKLICVAS